MVEKKLLLVGETDNGEKICIKFLRPYSQAAHEKCANTGIFEASDLRAGVEGVRRLQGWKNDGYHGRSRTEKGW